MSRHGRRSALAMPVAALLAGIAFIPPAAAWTGMVTWPTYFRTGPGQHFAMLQELSRGMTLDVRSCDGQWCYVQNGSVSGYVVQADVAKPPPVVETTRSARTAQTTQPTTQPAANCFTAQRSGYLDPEILRFCPRQ